MIIINLSLNNQYCVQNNYRYYTTYGTQVTCSSKPIDNYIGSWHQVAGQINHPLSSKWLHIQLIHMSTSSFTPCSSCLHISSPYQSWNFALTKSFAGLLTAKSSSWSRSMQLLRIVKKGMLFSLSILRTCAVHYPLNASNYASASWLSCSFRASLHMGQSHSAGKKLLCFR